MWRWIDNPEITAKRKRLYYLMLSLCGDQADQDRLEKLVLTRTVAVPTDALDSIVAAYLSLAKEDGLPLIEREFFDNTNASNEDVSAAITAIRFHGQDENIIDRERLVQVFRKLLDRPQLAQWVIPDLARWEDWTVVPQMIELFKTADPNEYFIRTPVIQYLAACPLDEAKQQIEVLRAIDPQAVRRGLFFAQRGAESAEVAPPAPVPAAAPAPSNLANKTQTVADEETPPPQHPLPEQKQDATLTWSLVAAGVALVALLTAFLAYHRRANGGNKTNSGPA